MGIGITGKLSTKQTGEQVCSVYILNLMEAVTHLIDPKTNSNGVLAAALNIILMGTGAATARFGCMVSCAVAELGIEELTRLKEANWPLLSDDQKKRYPGALASVRDGMRISTMPIPGMDEVLPKTACPDTWTEAAEPGEVDEVTEEEQ